MNIRHSKLKWSRAIVILLLSSFFVFIRPLTLSADKATRTVTDMTGRKVEVPQEVSRVACLPGPTYELVFMLGGKDQIAVVRQDHKEYPLAVLTNPAVKDYSSSITQVGPRTRINVEEFLQADLDVVIYYNVPSAVEMLEEAGIPVICTWPVKTPNSLDEFVQMEERLVTSLARMLGRDAPQKAKKWCQYFEKKIKFIRSRTKDLTKKDRPRVYIGNSWGGNPLATWGGREHRYVVRLCGGQYVGKDIHGAKFPEVTLEQVVTWSPEVIVIDTHGGTPEEVIDSIYADPLWDSIPAVKNKKIYRKPSGVFHLDKASTKPVYYLWLAKKLHPKLFEDVDLVSVMQNYCQEFYNTNISEENVRRALNGWGAVEEYK